MKRKGRNKQGATIPQTSDVDETVYHPQQSTQQGHQHRGARSWVPKSCGQPHGPRWRPTAQAAAMLERAAVPFHEGRRPPGSSGPPQRPVCLTKKSAQGRNVDKPCSLYTGQEYSGTLALRIVIGLLCFCLICQHIPLWLSKRWRQKLKGQVGDVYLGKNNTIAKMKWLVCTRPVYIILYQFEILH